MVTVIAPGCHAPTLTRSFIQGLLQSPTAMWVPHLESYWPAYSPQHLCFFLQQCLVNDGVYGDRSLCTPIPSAPIPSAPIPSAPAPSAPAPSAPAPSAPELLFIGFSAGVVASIGAARWWQSQGGRVKACIAIDGWGVPVYGNFPSHRISHDSWTHCSSHLLGGTGISFYAQPGVEHLELWRSPHTTVGLSAAASIPSTPRMPGLLRCVSGPNSLQQKGDRPPKPSQAPIPSQEMTVAQFIHQLLQWYGEVP